MVTGGLLALLAMVLFAAPAAAQTVVASSATPSTYSGSGQTITFSFTVNSGGRVVSTVPTLTSALGLVYSCPITDTVNTNVNFTCTATYTTTGGDTWNGGYVQDQVTVAWMAFSTPVEIAGLVMRSEYVAPDTPPVVLFDPLNTVVVAGNNATFDAWGAGKPTPSVQWQVSTDGGGTFNDISGATSDILTFATTAADNGNQYRVVYTNYLGSATTAAATLSIQGAPVITTQPVGGTAAPGSSIPLSAAATGSPTPTASWSTSEDNGATYQFVSSALSFSLDSSSPKVILAKVVFTNTAGSVTSDVVTLTWAKQNQAITFASSPPASAVVGGATYTVAASATSGLAVSYSVDPSASNVCSIAGSTVSFQGIGTCTINANQAGNTAFNAAPQVQQAFAVGQGANIITFPALADTAFTSAPPVLGATASSGLAISYASNSTGICTVSGGTISFVTAGTCSVTASQAGDSNFAAAAPVTNTFAVTPGVNTITFPALADTAFTSAPPVLSATASSGLAISYASNSTAICTVSGGAISFVTAGTCSVTASQAGDSNFAAAAPVTNTFAVTPGTNTITFPALADTAFTSAPPALGATASSGLAISYASNSTAICTVSGGTISFVTAGTCSVTASQAGDSNFAAAAPVTNTFAVTPGTNTITFPALSDTAFTSAPPVLVATASSGLAISYASNSTAICTVSGGAISFVTAGTCSITASQAGDSNFAAAAPVTNTFAVTPGTNTITFPALADTAFTSAPPVLVATASSGLAISYASNSTAICTVSGGAISFVTAGTCSITASQAGDSNFAAATPVTNTFAVTPGTNTITFPALSDTAFTSAPPVLVATASSGLAISYASNSTAICTVSGGAISFVTAGTCSITASQAGDSNFAAAAPVTNTFAVTPGTNTITFPALSDTAFTSAPPVLVATASSGLAISYASNSTAICTVSGGTISFVTAGTCSVTASQAGDSNFAAAAPVTNTFAVTPGTNTITFPALADTAFTSAPPVLGATASSGLAISYASNSTAICTVSGGTISFVTAGTCSITASQAGDSNFAAAAPVTNTFAVTPGTNTITFPALATRSLGSGSFDLTATASSGLAVTYTSATPAICSVSGGAVNLLAVGTCTVQANQAGNAQFQAAPQVSQSFEIAPAATTVALTSSASTVFFRVPVTLTATVSGVSPTGTVEFNDGDTMLGTATLSGGSATFTTSALAAGTRQLTASYLGDASNLPGTSAAISVTVNARPNPAEDPDTRSSIDSQFRTAERFVRTQMTNVENRLSQLHSDGEGQDSMNLRFSQTRPQWHNGIPGGSQGLQGGTDGYGYSYSNTQPLAGGGAILAAFDPNAAWLPGAPLGMAPVAMGGGSGGESAGTRHAAGEQLERRAFHIWASGDVNFGKEQPNGAVEQRFTSSGITVGIDGKINSNLKLGAAFGFAWDHTRIGTNGSENDATNGSLTFYGSWRAASKLFVDGLIGKGYGTIDTTRFSSTGAVFLDGKRESEQTFAALIGTYETKLGSGIEFAPYLRADGIWVHLDSYTETGSPFWALAFQAADENSFSGSAGARARLPLGKGSVWKLIAKAEYRIRISGDYTQLLDYADIQGAQGSPFAITGQGVDSSTFAGGLGIEGNLHNLILRLNHDLTTLAGGNISNRISGSLMWRF